MSLLKNLNIVGDSTDLCCKPFPISVCVDWCPLTLTAIDLLCKQVLIKLNIVPLISHCSSFSRLSLDRQIWPGLLFFYERHH